MERQETERVTDRQVIKSRQKKFFAFCLAILIGCMPTVNVMAATYNVNCETIGGLLEGRNLSPGDTVNWTQPNRSGNITVTYIWDGGEDTPINRNVANEEVVEIQIASYNVIGLKYWKVTQATAGAGNQNPLLTFRAVIEEDKTEEDDDSDDTPFIYNPDALAAVYYENGVPSWKAKFGKQTQGAACAMAFKNALPAGWKEGITFSMSVEDKYTYDPKTGTLVLCVPDALQKTGRQYAVMGIDKNGKVTVFYDTDNKPFLFTSKLNLEGYAFALIYKEP